MALYWISMTNGVPPYGPASISQVAEAGSDPTTTIAVKISTTATPGLSRQDAIAMLQAIENYIRTDGTLASPVLVLQTP